MSPDDLLHDLRSTYDGRVFVSEDGHLTLALLHGHPVRVTTTVEIGPDVVRLYAGRIVHALSFEDAADAAHVWEVVEAIQQGGAAEYYLQTDAGLAFVGHRIIGAEFRYDTTDHEAAELLAVPL